MFLSTEVFSILDQFVSYIFQLGLYKTILTYLDILPVNLQLVNFKFKLQKISLN